MTNLTKIGGTTLFPAGATLADAEPCTPAADSAAVDEVWSVSAAGVRKLPDWLAVCQEPLSTKRLSDPPTLLECRCGAVSMREEGEEDTLKRGW